MNNYEEFQKLTRRMNMLSNTVAILGELVREHPELQGCIKVIATYLIEKMEDTNIKISKIYGEHGEGLIVKEI